MEVQLILKLAGVGLLTAVCCQILIKSGRDEQAMLVSIAGIVIVLFVLIEKIGNLFDTIQSVFNI